MELPSGKDHTNESDQDFDNSDKKSDPFFDDGSLVLEKLLPGYEMVGEPFLKPNGKGYVRIYAGLEQLGELADRFEPRGKFAVVADTNSSHYEHAAGEHGAVCVTHHMDESEWLVWFVNMFVESVCEIEAREDAV